jgi:hemolysin III
MSRPEPYSSTPEPPKSRAGLIDMSALNADLEDANTATHAVGLIAALFGARFLLSSISLGQTPATYLACGIYAASLISVFGASCLYHSALDAEKKGTLRAIDQICIYLLIGGTATPLFQTLLPPQLAGTMIATVWSIGAVGIALRLCFPKRLDGVGILLCLAMAWCGAGTLNFFVPEAPALAKPLIVGGGIAFTSGLLFYLSEPWFRWGHVIWHIFVLAGTALHFAAVTLAVG